MPHRIVAVCLRYRIAQAALVRVDAISLSGMTASTVTARATSSHWWLTAEPWCASASAGDTVAAAANMKRMVFMKVNS
jgi:hypothetical protein